MASETSGRADVLHPDDQRFPKNASGAFYTLGSRDPQGNWRCNCLACEAPEAEAPDLLAPLTKDNIDTYFVKQPQTPEEVDRACSTIRVCCVAALRYGGTDPAIIRQLGNDPLHCDFLLDDSGEVVPAPGGLASASYHSSDDEHTPPDARVYDGRQSRRHP